MAWVPTDLLESLDDAVSVIDRDRRWVYCNPASERVMGMRRTDVIGKRVEDVRQRHDAGQQVHSLAGGGTPAAAQAEARPSEEGTACHGHPFRNEVWIRS